jgi:hypothetical protein
MKQFTIFLLLLLLTTCSGKTGKSPGDAVAASDDKARLSIEAQPRQGFEPLRVTLRAVLQGVSPNDKEYYCLKQEWDFGDGAISTEEPNCDPYSESSKIETEFFAQHEYEDAGVYQAFFTLGDKKVISRKYQIVVIASERGSAAESQTDRLAVAR